MGHISLRTCPVLFVCLDDGCSQAAVPAVKDATMDMVAKIKVGSSTMAQVTELLGAPWRIMNDVDCHPEGYQGETWEYLGHDADGSVKINVQFDRAGVAQLISRGAAKHPVVVLAAVPLTNHGHEH